MHTSITHIDDAARGVWPVPNVPLTKSSVLYGRLPVFCLYTGWPKNGSFFGTP